MTSWLILSSLFTNKCLKPKIGIDTCVYFINDTNEYGEILYKQIGVYKIYLKFYVDILN